MLGLAGGDELVGDHHGLVRGDREADADRSGLSALALTQRCRCRVHTDELTITVDQRSTRVAGVDRRIRLDGVRDRHLLLLRGRILADVLRRHRAVERGDDTGGHGVGQAERIAQSHHRIAHGQLLRITDDQRFHTVGHLLELDDGDIGRGIATDDLRLGRFTVLHGHGDLAVGGVCRCDDVVVRDDVALIVVQRTRAEPLDLTARADLDRHHTVRSLLCDLGPVRSLDRLLGDLARLIILQRRERIVSAERESPTEEGGHESDRDRRTPTGSLLLSPRRLLSSVRTKPVRPDRTTRSARSGLRTDGREFRGIGPGTGCRRIGVGTGLLAGGVLLTRSAWLARTAWLAGSILLVRRVRVPGGVRVAGTCWIAGGTCLLRVGSGVVGAGTGRRGSGACRCSGSSGRRA